MKTFLQFLSEKKESEKDHIRRYTDLSRPVTTALWRHHHAGTKPPDEIEDRDNGVKHNIKALDAITHKSKLTRATDIHHGIARDPSKMADKHGHIHIPAYISGSDDYHVGKKFAVKKARRHDKEGHLEPAHVLTIHAKPGQYARDLSGKSIESHEKERLLPRNTKLRLHPQHETTKDANGRTVHNWHADISSQG